MQIHGGRVRRDFLLESAFCTSRCRLECRAGLILFSQQPCSLQHVMWQRKLTLLGLADIFTEGTGFDRQAALLSKGGSLGSCDSQPLLCLHFRAAVLLCAGTVLHPAPHRHQPPSFVTILGAHRQKEVMVSSARKLQRDLISAEKSNEHFILSGFQPWAICLRVMSVFRALPT